MTDKIKVAFITERMILGHGVDMIVDRIACGLSDSGYECDIYCNNYDETFKKQKPYNLIRLPSITASNVFDLESKVKKFKLLLNNRSEDIFIINSFPFYSLAGHLNKPVISINYGIVSTEGMQFKRKLFYKYMDFSQNFSYFRKSSSVISISNYLNNKLPGFIRKKSRCIYPGTNHYLEIKIDKNKVNEFRHKHGVKEDDVLLLYAGRLNPVNQPYKGTKELIELFHFINRKNSKIKLMMAGFGSQNDEIAIKNEGVIAIANAPWEMMPVIYSACDIYTTCTKWEGFDLPIVEAQTFGKPSICYNIGAHPEITQNNKTGFLVNTKEEFAQKILELSYNTQLRNEMGLNCLENAKKFSWQKTISEYDDEIKKVLNKYAKYTDKRYEFKSTNLYSSFESAESKLNLKNNLKKDYVKNENITSRLEILENISVSNLDNKDQNELYDGLKQDKLLDKKEKSSKAEVTVLIINYNSSLACLQECLNSLKNQTFKNFEIMIFDNASTNDAINIINEQINFKKINLNENIKNSDASEGFVSNEGFNSENIKLRIIKNETNVGLGKAINLSINKINTPYVLISNFDVIYDKNALEELVLMIKSCNENIIGLAPKIKLAYRKDYIESVGTYLDTSLYDGYQGLGQLDLHQYDVPEDIFGVSFTSAFIKTDAFKENCAGKVDETFFLFYEDFDFCFRANIMGYKFKSCPNAIVYHKYSYSFREESSAFETKYYYKRLNLLKMMYKNADDSTIKRILPVEIKIMKNNLKDKNLRKVSKKILSDLKKSKKYLLKQREIIKLSKILSDAEAIKYYWGEQNFFDVVKNEPKYEIANLEKTYQRLFVITGSSKYMEYISYLHSLDFTKFKFEPEILRHKLHSKLENEPISVHEFIDKIKP